MADTDGVAWLRASEEKYRALFELRDEGFCVFEMLFDADGTPVDYRFLETNATFEHHTGLYNAVGKTAHEMIPNLEPHWVAIYGEVALTGQPVRFENESRVMGRWFDVYAFRLGDTESRRVALLFHNITEQKQAEEALRASEIRYRALAHASANSVYRFNKDSTRLLEVYGGDFLQLANDESRSKMWLEEYVHPEDRERVNATLQRARETQTPYEVELRGRKADGTWAWAMSRGVPVRNDAGEVVEWIGSAADISQRKRVEDELREVNETLEQRVRERSQQVHDLAVTLTLAEQEERQRIAQILHDDLQQRLFSLLLRLRMIQEDTQAGATASLDGAIEELMAQLIQAVRVTRTLVTELNPPILETEGLAAALHWLVEYMQESYGLTVHLDVITAREPQSVAIRTLVVQMTRELLFNVVKHAQTKEAFVRVGEEEDNSIQIRVSDRGVGFDATRVMENRTRRGYGLRTMSERLALVGGTVEIEADSGKGSQVTLCVPSEGA